MNWYSQLNRLIFSFYRENPTQLHQLHCLQTCKLSRRWGVFQIHCLNHETARDLIDVIGLIREPIAQLRLAHQIKISVKGSLLYTFPVDPSKLRA